MPTGRSTPYIGDKLIPPSMPGILADGVLYINPYCWVDDHLVVYGNHGSLDHSTDGVFGGCLFRKHLPLLSLKLTAKPPPKWAETQKEINLPTMHFHGRFVSFREDMFLVKLGEVDLVLFCVKRLKNSFLKF